MESITVLNLALVVIAFCMAWIVVFLVAIEKRCTEATKRLDSVLSSLPPVPVTIVRG